MNHNHSAIVLRCPFCGRDEVQSNDQGIHLCRACGISTREMKCERCGGLWVHNNPGNGEGHKPLCSSCSMSDFVGELDPHKLDVVRERVRSRSALEAVKEAHEQFQLSIGKSMDVVVFLQQEEAKL